MKKITCRTHNGVFKVVVRRGRPPVRCTESNPCTAAANGNRPVKVDAGSPASKKPTKKELAAAREALEQADKTRRNQKPLAQIAAEAAAGNADMLAKDRGKSLAAPTKGEASNGRQASLELAKKAKAQLVEHGWEVKGEAKGDLVTISGHRGDELICIAWRNGVVASQDYSLWSVDMPSRNGVVPPHKLPFDPDWINDRELAAYLVGTPITWWNRISGKEEKGVCGKDTISIEHRFDGAGHEIPSERLIKFIDNGNAMRLIQLGQLLKVGK